MSRESNLKLLDSKKKVLLNDFISETSPSYQFCRKISEINDTRENGWTPIYRSIISNDIEALKDLLKFGGDPNIPNNLGETPLYLCVDINNIEALNILLNNDPKPNCNIQKRNGNTALHLAIKKRRLNFATFLLENNADPNISNKLYSQTPTHLAIINHLDEQILEKFKNCNADIYNLKDKYDKTAYDYALETKDVKYVQLIKKIFGDNTQGCMLYNNLSEDNNININKSIEDSKSNNKDKNKDLKNSIEKKTQNALSNSNIRQILNDYKNLTYDNFENINFNKDKNNNNNKDKDKDKDKDRDKEKIKEIIVSEVNKVNVSELSSNNNYSTPKEKLNSFNIESNYYDNQISPLISNISKENNNINKKYNDSIYETNPLEMMNQIIKSNESKNKEKISNNDSLSDNNELNDSLEINKQENYIDKYNNKKDQEISEFFIKNNNEYKEKNRLSYHNCNKNKEKIIPNINLLNMSNNNKSNRNTINSNFNNEINSNTNTNTNINIQNIKRKSFGSNYESSTNQNSTRGTCSGNIANLQISNIINSLKNNDIKTNDFYLTEEKDKEKKINMNNMPYKKKTKSINDNKYLPTEEEFNKENIIRNKNKKEKIEDNNIHTHTHTNDSFLKLRDWLISCDLISYYNLLKNNSLCNIERYIKNIKKNKKITYKDIENLGIRKPGHIFRFLIKLDIDANIIDYDIHSKIINKFNSNILSTMGLTMSNNELRCCGMVITFGNKDYNNNTYNYTNNYSDIFHFLKYLDLMKFKENFIHNGFDQVDYIILQLFSEYKFDKIILKEFLHIYDDNDKKKVINNLYEEKKRIAKELGIYIEDNEKEIILNTQINDNYDSQECLIF